MDGDGSHIDTICDAECPIDPTPPPTFAPSLGSSHCNAPLCQPDETADELCDAKCTSAVGCPAGPCNHDDFGELIDVSECDEAQGQTSKHDSEMLSNEKNEGSTQLKRVFIPEYVDTCYPSGGAEEQLEMVMGEVVQLRAMFNTSLWLGGPRKR